jgi:type IV pilus assembly protein PilC
MKFMYQAANAEGSFIDGVLEADSEAVAEEILWRSGLTIIDLKKSLNLPPLHEMLPSLLGVKRRDLIQFSRGMASLLDAGISLLQALEIQSSFGKRSFKAVLQVIMKDLEKGARFSEACAKHRAIFPPFFIYLLKTGEEAGNLSDVLNEIAGYMEKDEAVASKVRRSLAYPSFVLLLAVGAVFVLLTFVVPAVTSLFGELRADLPTITRALIAVGDFFSNNFLYMIVGVVGLVAIGYVYSRTPSGKRRKDTLILKIPIVGNAARKAGLARFSRNLAMLISAGISLFDALKLISDTQENSVLAESIAKVCSGVEDGEMLSKAIASDPVFPRLMAEIVRLGEETGNLQGHLLKVANLYEEEADRAIAALTGSLTPALTIGVGIIIALIAITLFTSIYSIAGSLPH